MDKKKKIKRYAWFYTPIARLVARGPWSPGLGFESCSTRGANSTSDEFAPLRGGLAGGILQLLINGTSHKPLHFRGRALYSKPTLTWRRIPCVTIPGFTFPTAW